MSKKSVKENKRKSKPKPAHTCLRRELKEFLYDVVFVTVESKIDDSEFMAMLDRLNAISTPLSEEVYSAAMGWSGQLTEQAFILGLQFAKNPDLFLLVEETGAGK